MKESSSKLPSVDTSDLIAPIHIRDPITNPPRSRRSKKDKSKEELEVEEEKFWDGELALVQDRHVHVLSTQRKGSCVVLMPVALDYIDEKKIEGKLEEFISANKGLIGRNQTSDTAWSGAVFLRIT